MVLKIINATEAKVGAMILVDNEPYIVKSNDVSKTGKHGSAKCRIEAVGIIDGRKIIKILKIMILIILLIIQQKICVKNQVLFLVQMEYIKE